MSQSVAKALGVTDPICCKHATAALSRSKTRFVRMIEQVLRDTYAITNLPPNFLVLRTEAERFFAATLEGHEVCGFAGLQEEVLQELDVIVRFWSLIYGEEAVRIAIAVLQFEHRELGLI